jgi:hypothetical protein
VAGPVPSLALLLVLALVIAYLLFVIILVATAPRFRPGREAEARAAALLEDLLTEDERRRLERDGYLRVPSPSRPGRTYQVPRRRGQVRVYEGGALVMELCVGPVGWLPDGDLILLHKLMIEGNEAEYLRVANRFTPTGRQLGWPRRAERGGEYGWDYVAGWPGVRHWGPTVTSPRRPGGPP